MPPRPATQHPLPDFFCLYQNMNPILKLGTDVGEDGARMLPFHNHHSWSMQRELISDVDSIFFPMNDNVHAPLWSQSMLYFDVATHNQCFTSSTSTPTTTGTAHESASVPNNVSLQKMFHALSQKIHMTELRNLLPTWVPVHQLGIGMGSQSWDRTPEKPPPEQTWATPLERTRGRCWVPSLERTRERHRTPQRELEMGRSLACREPAQECFERPLARP